MPMEWRGLKELQDELAKLPEDCKGEAAKVVEAHVNAAYVTIKRVYVEHRYTGTLAQRLSISPLKVSGAMTTGLVLRSGSPLAWLFDHGSKARHYTGIDKLDRVFHNASRGKMPARPVFARTVGFAKRQILQDVIEMLRRRGASSVTGG